MVKGNYVIAAFVAVVSAVGFWASYIASPGKVHGTQGPLWRGLYTMFIAGGCFILGALLAMGNVRSGYPLALGRVLGVLILVISLGALIVAAFWFRQAWHQSRMDSGSTGSDPQP